MEVGFWRIDKGQRRIPFTPMADEERLEDLIAGDLSIVGPDLLLIGRQVRTAFNKSLDLLAMDANGDLVVIELKRDRTPRDAVAQLLDYGSWVVTLRNDDIARIFIDFQRNLNISEPTSLDDAFKRKFRAAELPDELNSNHRLLLVAGSLDAASERIITYLNEQYDVPINALFFGYFLDGEAEYLSRVMLLEAEVADVEESRRKDRAPWNGEYYVSFGGDRHRKWEDASRFGYISAGGGSWYTGTLQMLEPGDRIWVNVPSRGYVGVGIVEEAAVPASEFMLPGPDGTATSVTTRCTPRNSAASAAMRRGDGDDGVLVLRVDLRPPDGGS